MAKKILTILLLFCSCLLAQDTATYTVCTSGCDYATFTAAEAAHDQDLVANDSLLTFSGEDTGDLVENLVIDDWTVDATHYAVWTVASGHRHDGTRGTGVTINPSASGHCIQVYDSYMRVEYLELTGVEAGSDEGVRVGAAAAVPVNVALKWLLIYDLELAGSDGIYFGNWDVTDLLIEGCIIIDCDRAGVHSQQFSGAETQTVKLKHTTILGGNKGSTSNDDYGGIVIQAGTAGGSIVATCDNVIVMNTNTTEDYQKQGGSGTETFLGDNNMSEDVGTDMPGGNSKASQTYADQFTSTTANAEDIHLKSGNDAEDAGHTVTLQTAEDFEGDAIPQNSVHDMGADEVVPAVAGGISRPNIMRIR